MSDRGCLLDASGALNNVSAEQISPHDVSLMLSLPPYLPQIEVDCSEMKGQGEGGQSENDQSHPHHGGGGTSLCTVMKVFLCSAWVCV